MSFGLSKPAPGVSYFAFVCLCVSVCKNIVSNFIFNECLPTDLGMESLDFEKRLFDLRGRVYVCVSGEGGKFWR